jgi:acetylornithine deacetylase/succinyl-diaminopimelate desuccinylase-like protein
LELCDRAIAYAAKNQNGFRLLLEEFIKIPSISTEIEHAPDMEICAKFLAGKLSEIGMENVRIFTTPKHPIVYADYVHSSSKKPTVLVYGHYDVQPVDPLELWNNNPFSPTLIGTRLFARGASDMKGQVTACLASIESIMKTGELPVNLKFVFEGEEEIGSPSLKGFLEENKSLLKADVALNPDTGMIGIDIPTIVYGLRGLAYFEVRITGPDHDLHSGVFGGVVHNPAQVLCDLISGMHDNSGRVTLPHFYDDVLPFSSEEKLEIARLNLGESYYMSQTGAPAIWGEQGFTSVERIGGRPTLELNGFLSGFAGTGAKTVIPSKAMAKISMRLVPNQNPEKVHQQLISYFETHAPKSIKWEVEKLSGGYPSISDINLPATKALAKALETTWGTKPTYKREGGSVPVVADMQQILGIDSVLTGFGLPDDNIHSPNESLHLPTWAKGIESLIRFFFNVGNQDV